MADISSVKDPLTGSNYGGIKQDSLGVNASYKEYLNNLLETTRRPVGGPLQQQQYTPPGTSPAIIGQSSSQTLGSQPIFGSGAAIFPQAILDNFERAKKDSELAYLNEIGDVSMDTFKMQSVLKNPWHNQAFSAKYQSALDVHLDAIVDQLGGDYMKGMKAASVNKDLHRMMKGYKDYADIYNSVFDNAVGILSLKPEDGYASPETRRAALKFFNDYENLDDLTIDVLAENARKFKSVMAVNDVVDIVIGDGKTLSDKTEEEYRQNFDMGTDKYNAWVKETKKGLSDKDLKEYYDLAVEMYPDLMDDPIYAKHLWSEMRHRVGFGTNQTLTKIGKLEAKEQTWAKNNGWDIDKDGRLNTVNGVATAFTQFAGGKYNRGQNAIIYPQKGPQGQAPLIVLPAGQLIRVLVPDGKGGSVIRTGHYGGDMNIKQEYDLYTTLTGGGRWVEGDVFFEETELYKTPDIRTSSYQGEITAKNLGDKPGTKEQKVPFMFHDIATGKSIPLHGKYQVVVGFDDVKNDLYPIYPMLKRAHADMTNTRQGGAITEVTDVPDVPPPLAPAPEWKRLKKAKKYNTQEEAVADIGVWEKGEQIKVGDVRYIWNGSKLQKPK